MSCTGRDWEAYTPGYESQRVSEGPEVVWQWVGYSSPREALGELSNGCGTGA
jgi:hypothetical protein